MWLPSAADKGEEKDYPVVSYRKFKQIAEDEPESSVVVSQTSSAPSLVTGP
jgi:hypothetical protein